MKFFSLFLNEIDNKHINSFKMKSNHKFELCLLIKIEYILISWKFISLMQYYIFFLVKNNIIIKDVNKLFI